METRRWSTMIPFTASVPRLFARLVTEFGPGTRPSRENLRPCAASLNLDSPIPFRGGVSCDSSVVS